MEKNSIEKKTWTENDFEQMAWHDCKVHAMTFGADENEIIFDIDFILEWIPFGQNETHYNFLVAPATLVFRNVYDINMNLPTADITIDAVRRENPVKPKNAAQIKEQVEYDWSIETTHGEITFKSVGFTQRLRKEPVSSSSQSLNLIQRGGVAF